MCNRKKVLLIDDDIFTLDLVRKILEKEYEIVTELDPETGFRMLEDEQFDLLLLDWMMPRLDGYKLLNKLKEDEKTRDIPVIFISGKVERESIDMVLEAEAIDFVTKPFTKSDLLTAIEKVLNHEKTRE